MTDYNFPIDWETFTPQEKHDWYCRERLARRYLRQSGVSQEAISEGDTFEMANQVLRMDLYEQFDQ